MINKKILQTISNKEMDRKEFLKFSGIALLGLVGFKGIVNLLLANEPQTNLISKESSSRGFGSGKYGA